MPLGCKRNTMHVLNDKEDLALALAESYESRILICKISNTCPQSKSLYKRLRGIAEKDDGFSEQTYLLVVQDAREVSNHIAMKFGVIHESPQVLIVENEDVVYYESHGEIDLEKVQALLRGSSVE